MMKKGTTDDNVDPPTPKVNDSLKSSGGDNMTPDGQGGTMSDVGEGTDGARGGSTADNKECTYNKKGVCDIHGEGAVKKLKPSFTIEVGKNGRKMKKYVKKYVCDVSMDGKKLRQSRLSFPSMTVNVRGGSAADIGEGGNLTTTTTTSTTTVGQATTTTTSCVQRGKKNTR